MLFYQARTIFSRTAVSQAVVATLSIATLSLPAWAQAPQAASSPASMPSSGVAPEEEEGMPSSASSASAPQAPSPAASGVVDAPTIAPVTIRARRDPPQAPGQRSMQAKDMRRVPGSMGDPLKALQSLPGVSVADDSSSDPAIRGSRPEDNVYYIDGLPSGRLFHMGGMTSVLNASLVERFDLYAAGGGPEYGDATGGVLDVKLRNPRLDRIGGILDVSLLRTSVLLEGPLAEGHSFYLAGQRSYIDLFVKEVSDGTDEESEGVIVQMPKFHDYLGKYLWQLSDGHQLSMTLNGSSDSMDVEVPKNADLAKKHPVYVGKSGFRERDHMEAVSLDSALGSQTSNRLSVGQRISREHSNIGTDQSIDVKVRDQFVMERFSFKPHDDHTMSLGGEAHQERASYAVALRKPCTEFEVDCDPSSVALQRTDGGEKFETYNAHLKDRWQFTPHWAATAGVHYSDDRYLKRQHTEPRTSLEWQWSDATQFSAAWGRYNQRPQAHEILKDIGNPQLNRLHATHSVLGMTQQWGEGWSWRTEVYRKQFEDLVVSDPARNYVNGGSGQADGLELLFKKSEYANHPLSGWVSVSWVHNQRRNDLSGQKFRFEFDQPLMLNLVGTYQLPYGWEIGGKFSYQSGKPYTEVVGTGTYPDGRVRPLYGEQNGRRLPAYHRLDLRAEQKVSKTFTYYFEMLNAYNRQNVSGYAYDPDYKKRREEKQLGMIPSFGIEWKL